MLRNSIWRWPPMERDYGAHPNFGKNGRNYLHVSLFAGGTQFCVYLDQQFIGRGAVLAVFQGDEPLLDCEIDVGMSGN